MYIFDKMVGIYRENWDTFSGGRSIPRSPREIMMPSASLRMSSK